MKKVFLVTALICFCFAGISFAGDVELTKEQALTIQIEQLQGTIDYTKSRMKILEDQYKNYAIVGQQAAKELSAVRLQLKALERKKK